ncbi:hypothetical protein [Sphingomonas humi]|uniref:DUF7847 domain-containing protein n=1 Tax=Sphingomonas humi TaxID=335630 RepID=A0ABP7S013_9SPHN
MKLSIGQAWDETKAVFRADGGAISAVALALTVLPGTILETVAPSSQRAAETAWYVSLLGLAAALLSLAGQLAISRIALGPSTTVGAAIGHGFRRVPALFGALFLLFLPIALVGAALIYPQLGGIQNDPSKMPSSALLTTLLVIVVFFFLLVRMLFITPLAADRDLNSIQLLKEAWGLSKGRFWKLFVMVLLLALVALIILGALGGALSAVVILALGAIEPGNTSALLVALIQQLMAAFVSVLFVVVVCRLYRQAESGGTWASVPHAGGE